MRCRHVRLHDGAGLCFRWIMLWDRSQGRWRRRITLSFSRRTAFSVLRRTVFGVQETGNNKIWFGEFWDRMPLLWRTLRAWQTSAGNRGKSNHILGHASSPRRGAQPLRSVCYNWYLMMILMTQRLTQSGQTRARLKVLMSLTLLLLSVGPSQNAICIIHPCLH